MMQVTTLQVSVIVALLGNAWCYLHTTVCIQSVENAISFNRFSSRKQPYMTERAVVRYQQMVAVGMSSGIILLQVRGQPHLNFVCLAWHKRLGEHTKHLVAKAISSKAGRLEFHDERMRSL
eukprot:scaffold16091_cov18-Prasinocladus_malaysianus.AAC.1